MIPAALCAHFFPAAHRGCNVGLRAPQDCKACPLYDNGESWLAHDDPIDRERAARWDEHHGAAERFESPR